MAADETQAEAAREAMKEGGAESIDRAREMWWIGLRDVEKEHYEAGGGNFTADEGDFRAGFEAAQDPRIHGETYVECLGDLRKRYPQAYDASAFRDGFARGRAFCSERRRKTAA